MKMVFKFIWLVLVVGCTLIELIYIFIITLFRTIFNLKWPKTWWSDFNSANYDWENKWGGYAYYDKTPLETIIRRYKFTFC